MEPPALGGTIRAHPHGSSVIHNHWLAFTDPLAGPAQFQGVNASPDVFPHLGQFFEFRHCELHNHHPAQQ
jgi:hypothetical protein